MADKTMAQLRYEAKVRKFCRAMIFDGLKQIDAWRKVTPRHVRHNADQQSKMATSFANKPFVKQIYLEMVKASQPHDMETPGSHFAETRADRDRAREAGNWNSVAQHNRLLGQFLEMIRDGANVSLVFGGSDEKIIEAIGRGDPERTELARKLLVPAGFPKPEEKIH